VPLLFSYGTLQQEAVQLSTFGRRLRGEPDQVVGFEQAVLKIEDPQFVAASGKADHAIVKFNGRDDSRVRGMVFEVSDEELARADRYEPAGYERISTVLASGKRAWVYAEAVPKLFAVFRTRGPAWQEGEPLERQAEWGAHAAFMNALAKEGFVVLGGPLDGSADVLLVVRAESPEAIRARLAADPWSVNGLLQVARVLPWTLRLGSLA
jgi:uncharacterized protein YciI